MGPHRSASWRRRCRSRCRRSSSTCGVLQQCGLVESEKVGRVRTCRLGPATMRRAEAWIAERRAEWERGSTGSASTSPMRTRPPSSHTQQPSRRGDREMSESSTEHATFVDRADASRPRPARVFARLGLGRGQGAMVRAAHPRRATSWSSGSAAASASRLDGPDGARYTYAAVYRDIVAGRADRLHLRDVPRRRAHLGFGGDGRDRRGGGGHGADAHRAGRVPRRPRQPRRARARNARDRSRSSRRWSRHERRSPPGRPAPRRTAEGLAGQPSTCCAAGC